MHIPEFLHTVRLGRRGAYPILPTEPRPSSRKRATLRPTNETTRAPQGTRVTIILVGFGVNHPSYATVRNRPFS